MATTFHIPDQLLTRVDERARAKNLSRNRFVILALKKALEEEEQWSPDFLNALDDRDPSLAKEVDSMLREIKKRRKSKKPVDL